MTSDSITVTVNICPEVADCLAVSRMRNFRAEQPHRFGLLGIGPTPDNEPVPNYLDTGTMSWHLTMSDALLYAAYEDARGYYTRILTDRLSVQSDGQYVVISTRAWE